jgi:cellobiose PTS system EIIC component
LQPFWSYIIALGGGGATLGLCILLLRSKSVELRTLGKISIGPAIFNINEPIIFGLPMVLNPIMMIPFIFVPVVNSIIAYACMALHIVGKGVIETPWTTPAPLGAALGCMDIKAGIMVIGLIILDMALYYPFVKLLEKQKLEEENSK